MGYDLHISRASDWAQSQSDPITDAEWLALVAGDPELTLTGTAEASTPDGALRYENAGLALWIGHPGGIEAWFDPRRGAIVVKNPDEPTIAKMITVAQSLRARVIGDDGEVYESPEGPPRQPSVPPGQRLTAWFRRLRPAPAIEPAVLPFAVGDRVSDIRGEKATVLGIDLRANHGMGSVRVRFDDGRELSFAAHAHGLTPVDAKRDGSETRVRATS